MNILFLSDNFPPERNASATRVHERACYWVREGHRVTVITCAPNFPDGKVFPGYRNRGSVKAPEFSTFAWFQAGGADARVPSG